MKMSWPELIKLLVSVVQTQDQAEYFLFIQSKYLRILHMVNTRAMVLQLQEHQNQLQEVEEHDNKSITRWLKAMCCCWLRSHTRVYTRATRNWRNLVRCGILHIEHVHQHAKYSLLFTTHVLMSCDKICTTSAHCYMY